MARKYAAPAPSSGYTILLVGTDPGLLSATKLLLTTLGHTVVTAVGGAQALVLFRPGQTDVVIVDSFMPQMTGEAFVGHLREIDADVPVLLQTGYAGDPPLSPEQLASLAVQGFHDKADGLEGLLSHIEGALQAVSHPHRYEPPEAQRDGCPCGDQGGDRAGAEHWSFS